MEVADLRVRFSADGDRAVTGAIDRVNRGLDTVDGNARRAGGALESMWKVTGGVLVARGIELVAQNIIGMAGGLLSAQSNAEQLRVSLDIAVGSAAEAGRIFSELQKLAAATPFQFPELVQSAVRLESFGLDALDVMGTLGDTAAGMGKSLEQVTAAYLDAGMGQFIRLQELGIDAATVGDEVVFSWVENGQTIRKAVDKNNAELIRSTIAAIWNDKYAGAMEKQSRTFAGQWSTLKDNATLAMMGATDGVFGALTDVLGFANQVFADGFVEAVRSIGGPLEDVGDLVAGLFDAFGSGEGVDDLMAGLFGPGSPMAGAPALLKAVVENVLLIADALGDIRAAWDANGLDGVFDVLGEELLNIAESLGDVAIDVTVAVASWAITTGEDLYYALKNKIAEWLGLPGATALDGTNATVGMTGGLPLGAIAVEILDWAVTSETSLTVRVLEYFDVQTTETRAQAAERGREHGRDVGQGYWDAFAEAVENAFSGDGGGPQNMFGAFGGRSGGTGMPGGKSLLQTLYDNTLGLDEKIDLVPGTTKIETAFAELGGIIEGIAVGFATGFWNGLDGAVSDFESGAQRFGARINSSIERGLFGGAAGVEDPTTGIAPQSSGLVDRIAGFFRDLPGKVLDAVGTLELDIPTPELPDWMTTDWGWITGPINTLIGYITQIKGLIAEAIGLTNEAAAAQAGSGGGGGGNAAAADAAGGGNYAMGSYGTWDRGAKRAQGSAFGAGFTQGAAMVLPAPDTSAFDAALGNVTKSLEAFTDADWRAALDADPSRAVAALGVTTQAGFDFAGQTFTAAVDADTSRALAGIGTAWQQGLNFAAQSFTATATISVDTSALWRAVADVGNAMSAIRDLLPSSPAKRGPFSGPVPNLDYIADSFRASLSRMQTEAEIGMLGVRAALDGHAGGSGGGRSGRGGGLRVQNAYVYPATADLQREITASAVGEWRAG